MELKRAFRFFVFLIVLVVCGSSRAGIILNFATLPSSQGFSYFAGGNGSGFSETQLFSVDGTKLTMNSMGLPMGAEGGNHYQLNGAVISNSPYTLEWRSRVLEDEGPASFGHFGFSLFVQGTHSIGVGMSTQKLVVQFAGENRISIDHDNTVFRDYKIVADPNIGWDLLVDGSPIFQDLSFFTSSQNFLSFGDNTGFQNTKVELAKYQFSQTAVPEPNAWSMVAFCCCAFFSFQPRHRSLIC